jgi:hypothetical protein
MGVAETCAVGLSECDGPRRFAASSTGRRDAIG